VISGRGCRGKISWVSWLRRSDWLF